MDILIALAHFLISIIIMMGLGFLWTRSDSLRTQKYAELITSQVTSNLDIRDASLNEMKAEFLRIASEQFSPNQFENRAADFIGVVYFVFVVLTYTVEIGIFLAAVYFTIFVGLEYAAIVWINVLVAMFAYAIGYLVNAFCKLLTDRLPGQPKSMRERINREKAQFELKTP